MGFLGKTKRFEKLGKGAFSVAKRVLPRKGRIAGPLVGKVVKIVRGSRNIESSIRTKKLIEKYVRLLGEAGVKTTPTKIKIMLSKKRHQILIIQPLVPKELLLQNYLQSCSKSEALEAFRQASEITRNIQKFNAQSQTKIGLDFHVNNLAKTENGLAFFDFYPPYVINTTTTLTTTDITRKRRNLLSRFRSEIMPRRAELLTIQRTKARMDLRKQFQKIAEEFIKLRPELEEHFEALM